MQNYTQVIDCKHFDLKKGETRVHILPSFKLSGLSLFELQKVRKVFRIQTSQDLEDKENSLLEYQHVSRHQTTGKNISKYK